nr:atherin-like [Aegilops tauschii subsp. strangulata]
MTDPQEEAAVVAQQTPPGHTHGGFGAPERPTSLAAVEAPVQAPVPHPPQALVLADHGPSARPGALEEAYTVLDQLWTDLQGINRCMPAPPPPAARSSPRGPAPARLAAARVARLLPRLARAASPPSPPSRRRRRAVASSAAGARACRTSPPSAASTAASLRSSPPAAPLLLLARTSDAGRRLFSG